MSKLKLLSIAVIGLLVINIGIVGFLLLKKPPMPPEGRPPLLDQDGGPPMNQAGPKQIIIDRLHFDKEQVSQYESLITDHQSSIRKLDDSIRITKNDLYHTLSNDSFAGKDSLIARLGVLQKQIELLHYDHFAAIKKICKPDQLSEFNKLTNELARFFAPGRNRPPVPPKD